MLAQHERRRVYSPLTLRIHEANFTFMIDINLWQSLLIDFH